MESQVQRLVDKAWKKYQETPDDQRLLVGVAGIPGSGKTTLAQIITNRLNEHAVKLHPEAPPPTAFLPMDGFHLTRAALSAMPDPTTAHARRGAAFTFDAPKFLALDPKEEDIKILPEHRIVVSEGLYLALDKDVWRDAAALFDKLWFVEVDFEVARKRLGERHVRAGIVKDLEEGDKRARENDLVNGEEIIEYRLKVDEVIQSKEDGSWAHE
ncbi:ATP-dependent kinase-like protein notR' [Cladobotryum mycophilum]|uniref:ATP-dependent kinase-like protein notR n=1 Tax=Cladobotryum mycophilum TaxID=491253 RepID=A0ABR0SJN3_9HYPO